MRFCWKVETALSSLLGVNLFLTQTTLESIIPCLAGCLSEFASAINSVACDRTTSLRVPPRFISAIVTWARHGCSLLSHTARKARGTGQTPLLTDITVVFLNFFKASFCFL